MDGGPETTRPGDPLVVPDPEEQVELLGEDVVVVIEGVAEEGKRLDEGAPTDQQLGPARRHQVEGGVLLEDPNRVIGAEDGHRREEPDPRGPPGRGRQDRGRRRRGEVGTVVLAQAVHIETDRLCRLDLLEHLPEPLTVADRRPPLGNGLGEAGDTQFHAP